MAEQTKSTLILDAKGMSLSQSLFCGQTFSWHKTAKGEYTAAVGKRAVLANEQGKKIMLVKPNGGSFTGDDEQFWKHYFALDIDYEALLQRFCENEKLAECVREGSGIRVLNQPFWDTLLSFIISQNNNIKRIEKIVRALCENFGQELAQDIFAFPKPDVLSALTEDELKALGAGYRAAYLISAAKCVAGGIIQESALRQMPTQELRRALLNIHGVGPKVADCVLLFGLERTEVAPMDVWMKRAITQIFGGNMPSCAGGYEGIAQQYIFNWARENL